MGTLLLLYLHAVKGLNSPYDCYWLALLVSLDCQTALRWWIWRRQRL